MISKFKEKQKEKEIVFQEKQQCFDTISGFLDTLEDVQGLFEIKSVVERLKNLEKKSSIETQTKYLEKISSLTGQPPARPRRLVVRLTRRDLRDQLLACARVRRGATTADLGMPGAPTRFYINERLTKTNRQLFRQARETGNRQGWKYVWTKRGRILARQKPGEPVSIIRNEEDIRRVFGSL